MSMFVRANTLVAAPRVNPAKSVDQADPPMDIEQMRVFIPKEVVSPDTAIIADDPHDPSSSRLFLEQLAEDQNVSWFQFK